MFKFNTTNIFLGAILKSTYQKNGAILKSIDLAFYMVNRTF
jgi:hypothetical protein